MTMTAVGFGFVPDMLCEVADTMQKHATREYKAADWALIHSYSQGSKSWGFFAFASMCLLPCI